MTTQTTIRSNIYRHQGAWCHATWIDGEFDSSDPLDVSPDADAAEAADAVRVLYGSRTNHPVDRVDDV